MQLFILLLPLFFKCHTSESSSSSDISPINPHDSLHELEIFEIAFAQMQGKINLTRHHTSRLIAKRFKNPNLFERTELYAYNRQARDGNAPLIMPRYYWRYFQKRARWRAWRMKDRYSHKDARAAYVIMVNLLESQKRTRRWWEWRTNRKW
jgi:acyl-CoA-binding protein